MAGRVLDQRAETLREAACAGDTDTVQELISSGVDPNDQNHMNGWTAVHWAAKRGHGGVLRVLLENGGNLQTVNSKNETPVDVAHPAVLPILRAAGVTELPSSDEAPKQDGFTPNYLANPDFFYLKSTPGAGRHADAQKLASLKRKQEDMVAQQTAAASLPQANHAPAIAAPTLTPASVPQPLARSSATTPQQLSTPQQLPLTHRKPQTSGLDDHVPLSTQTSQQLSDLMRQLLQSNQELQDLIRRQHEQQQATPTSAPTGDQVIPIVHLVVRDEETVRYRFVSADTTLRQMICDYDHGQYTTWQFALDERGTERLLGDLSLGQLHDGLGDLVPRDGLRVYCRR